MERRSRSALGLEVAEGLFETAVSLCHDDFFFFFSKKEKKKRRERKVRNNKENREMI